MAENRATRGVPLPGVWQVCVLAAAVVAAWLLWSEFRQNVGNGAAQHDPAENLRTMIQSSREGKLGLDQLTTLLKDDDPRTRRNALMVLAEMGHDAAETLPAIRERFADDDSLVRPAALAAFTRICDDPNDVNTAATAFLADSDTQVRELAARMLQGAGPAAISPLIAVAHSENPETRRIVIRLLPETDKDRDPGEVNAALRSLLDDSDQSIRLEAMKAYVGRGAASVEEVHGWLRSEEPTIVAEGLRAVESLDLDAAPIILPDLAALLEPDDGAKSWLPLSAIAHFKSSAAPLIPALLHRFSSTDSRAGFRVAKTLVEIGAAPKDVVPILIPLLASKGDAYNDCWQAGLLLAKIDSEEARRQVSQLIVRISARENEPMEGQDPDLNALSGLGSQAQEAMPLLIRLLSHKSRFVPSLAMSAMCRLGPDAAPAVPALVPLIDREYLAINALGCIGPAARSAVPRLLNLIDDEHLGQYAASALGQIGQASPEVLAALRRQLTRDSRVANQQAYLPQLRKASVVALVSLAGDAATTLRELLPLLKDTDPKVRFEAISGIGRLTGDRREAIEPLIKLLSHDDNAVRTAAALSLGQIGPDAKTALPALRNTVADRRNAVARSFQYWPHEKEQRSVSLIEAAQWSISAIEANEP